MSAAGPGPHLDPPEPSRRASERLSGGGFEPSDALEVLRGPESREVAELLDINQCTDAEVADLLDPDRNADAVADLLASLDL